MTGRTIVYEESRMPCHISDGPQTPEEADEQWERWAEIDPDAAYDEQRQIEIDAAAEEERAASSDDVPPVGSVPPDG